MDDSPAVAWLTSGLPIFLETCYVHVQVVIVKALLVFYFFVGAENVLPNVPRVTLQLQRREDDTPLREQIKALQELENRTLQYDKAVIAGPIQC